MNLKQLIDTILNKSSKWMLNEGKEVYKNNLVSNVKSKKVNDFYNIYGKVTDSDEVNQYNTHIRINLLKGSIEETKCGCEDFIENSIYNKAFLCKHLLGTTYKFQELALKRVNSKEDKGEKNCIQENGDIILNELKKYRCLKDKLQINVKVNYVENASLPYYEAEFKIGKSNMYLINNLESFIEARNNNKKLLLGSDLEYNPKINFFSCEDEEIIDFIEECISINESSQCYYGRKLKIMPNFLKRFLRTVKSGKVNLKYDYLDSVVQILPRDLPLSFTLKDENENFVLIARNKLPIMLVPKGDVFLFERDIYLLTKVQSEAYKYFYEYLRKDGKILFSKKDEILTELLIQLDKISKDIILDEGVKKYINSNLKWKFYLYKELESISCKVNCYYGEEVIDIVKDSKKKCSLIRDLKKEEIIDISLGKYKFVKKADKYLFIGEDYEFYDFFYKGMKSLKNHGEIILCDELKEIKIYDSTDIKSSITENSDGTLSLYYSIGQMPISEFKQVFEAYKSNRDFYRTKDNNFIDLKDDGIREFIDLLESLNWINYMNEDAVKVNKNAAYFLQKNIEERKLDFIKGKALLDNISMKLMDIQNMSFDIPKELNAILREYQIAGYKWLKTLSHMGFGGILADEMGLGKTIQTIGFLLSEKNTKSIIITPTSLIYNWKSEFDKFAPTLKIGIVHGNRVERMKVFEEREEYDILLTTYGTLRNDFELYKDICFDYCIIDEGQNIKNPLAQSTDTVKNLNAKNKFALTGTPIENNLMELWSIFDFIMPGYLYDKEKFEHKFVKTNENKLKELKILIEPFILRREKEDVLKELPDKIEKKFLVEMTPEQSIIYKSYMKEIKEKLKNNKEDKITVFSYLTKLRQLCLDPSLLINDYMGGSGKINLVLNLVQEGIDEGKKILLFSQFTSVLKNISTLLNDEGIDYLYLDGSTSASDRVKLVKKFNESTKIKVFLISLKAGGTGLNLTSANLVIHFDPWWNPAIEDQATDRAHRIGQKNIVHVIKLVSQGTIEEKIIKLQEDKKELIDNVMNGDLQSNKLLNSLSEEEIMNLFNDN